MDKSCGTWKQFSRGRNQELEQKPATSQSDFTSWLPRAEASPQQHHVRFSLPRRQANRWG